MNRSGYDEYGHDGREEQWSWICYRGAVASAIRGQRGQALLREMLAAMDALPVKRLIANDLARDGEYCAIGTVGVARKIDLSALDPDDYDGIAAAFGIAPALVREIEYVNDDSWHGHTAELRFAGVRRWIVEQLAATLSGSPVGESAK